MNYVEVNNLSKSYSEKQLFRNISFKIEQGDKVSLIAKNALTKIRTISNGTCHISDFALAVTSSVLSIGSIEFKIIPGPASSIIGLAPFKNIF